MGSYYAKLYVAITFFRSSRSLYLAVNMEGRRLLLEQRPPKMEVVEDNPQTLEDIMNGWLNEWLALNI